MQNTDMLMSRYGVELPAGTLVPAVVLQFLQWLSDNHWTTAVEICPWNGREGGYFGAHSACDVAEDFLGTIAGAGDDHDCDQRYADLTAFVNAYFNEELAKDGLAEQDPDDDEPDFDEPDFDDLGDDASQY